MSDKTKKILKIVAVIAVVGSICTLAFAADANIKEIIGAMLGYVKDLFICIGLLLGVYAVGQLALAFKDDNPDQKAKAMTLLVCCAILMAIGPVMDLILTASKTGIEMGDGFLG